MFVAHQVGGAVAAYGAGLTRTVEGTYVPAFLTSGVMCIIAGLLCLFIGSRRADEAASTPTRAANPANAWGSMWPAKTRPPSAASGWADP
jgi:sugar phosphate permease